MDTKIMDKLFLELAQVTKATTPKENRAKLRIEGLESFIRELRQTLVEYPSNEYSIQVIQKIDKLLK